MRWLTRTALGVAVGLTFPAMAQDDQAAAGNGAEQPGDRPVHVVDLAYWDYEPLYADENWSAAQLLGADIHGPADEVIGEVENIIVGTGGMIESIIAEVGGFWDIGDTHVRVPWAEVALSFENGAPRVAVPVTEATVEDYDLFGGTGGEFRVVEEDESFEPRGWRVTELIDDYAALQDDPRYGWVEDVVFDPAGRIQAVIVDAARGRAFGPYAYPYYGYGHGYRPDNPYYQLPYSAVDVEDLKPFAYDRFEGTS